MSCRSNECGRLCPRFTTSTTITLTAGTLVINVPDTISYQDGCKYCIALAQNIPTGTPIDAPVVVTIGAGTTQFPLLSRCGGQVLAAQLATRTRYPVRVSTTATGGSFTVTRCLPEVDSVTLAALNDAAAAGGGGA